MKMILSRVKQSTHEKISILIFSQMTKPNKLYLSMILFLNFLRSKPFCFVLEGVFALFLVICFFVIMISQQKIGVFQLVFPLIIMIALQRFSFNILSYVAHLTPVTGSFLLMFYMTRLRRRFFTRKIIRSFTIFC